MRRLLQLWMVRDGTTPDAQNALAKSVSLARVTTVETVRRMCLTQSKVRLGRQNNKTFTSSARYKLIVRVVDISGTTTFTLFNKEVERLVVVPVENILAELTQDNPTTEMPAVLNNVIDKTCGFDVKISSYNTNLGYEEYTVVKLSEYDPAEVVAVAETSGAGAEAQNTT
ncbi:hypothetical protein POM88_051679 [Heracleum sosnowskyi]|uniref:Replication factor A C-terminal domain-containing protein n=1 Tax=Heracleum sosnowskyi TaxID=360622 RepID=A0AAD8H2C1_9APIA|nr:hypothetical protein POM88_051679 [Heracleum sosnowskyi]